MKLEGKVAWVTGGNSGIGAATARALAARGAKVLVTARDEDAGRAMVRELGGENALWARADQRERGELEAACAAAVERWGRLDLLFNSAGGGGTAGFFVSDDAAEREKCRDIFLMGLRLNTVASFDVAQIAANYMALNDPGENGERGSIVFVGSSASDKVWYQYGDAVEGKPFAYGYGCSKAAILGLARDLATMLGQYGIRVNTILPGYIHTPMSAKMGRLADEIWPPVQMFPREGGEPEHVASMAVEVFENPFVNRAQIRVDAGQVG